MKARRLATAFLVSFVAIGGLVAASVAPTSTPTPSTVSGPRRGVSLSGAEFGSDKAGFSNRAPGAFGRDYTYNTERTVQHYCDSGFGLIRLPVRWERLQPRLGEELDGMELARLRVAVSWVRKHGGSAIIDLHNYGRYTLADEQGRRAWIIDESFAGRTAVTREHLADFWRRIASAFKDDSAIYAFGLMNEPHDMGVSDWKGISQAAVDAIRSTGDAHRLLVAGNEWSKAESFAANGQPWINDSMSNVAYEAHCYFDRDGSGKYTRRFAEELAMDANLVDRGAERLSKFVAWCEQHQVKGFVGEFGVPQDQQWQPALAKFMAVLDQANMDACMWGAGEWWGDYPMSLQPRDGSLAPQLSWVTR